MAEQDAYDLNWITSVDDHVIEPPRVWLDRIPKKYHDVAPRVVTEDGGREFWVYEDTRVETGGLGATAGRPPEDITTEGYPYSQMRPGCFDPKERLKDMDAAGVLASLNFPSIPRFCGQLFWEAKDKELALLCVKAYNDWMIDEWCAGEGKGRLIPLGMIRPMGCLMDWIFSGMFQRFPNIKIALSEGSIGWIPWVLERAQQVYTCLLYTSDAADD